MNRKELRGFTLVEAIAAIAIIGVVGSIGTVTFFKLTDLWNKTRIQTELDNRAQAVFDTMRKDLMQIVPVHLSGKPLVGVSETSQDTGRFWAATLNTDQLSFVTRAPSANGFSTLALVSYSLDKEKMALVRRAVALGGAQGAGETETVVAEGVIDFCLEFAGDGAGWARGWGSQDLPKAIRISVTVVHPTRIQEQVARKAVIEIPVE